MIEIVDGDLFDVDVEAIVNAVNCAGVMGKGLALQYKLSFPENYNAYVKACKAKNLRVGEMFTFATGSSVNPKYIINFPTKRHWRGKSRLEDIESGLLALIQEVEQKEISSIAIPALGCGLGRLSWSVVRPLIEEASTKIPNVHVLLFEPKPLEKSKS